MSQVSRIVKFSKIAKNCQIFLQFVKICSKDCQNFQTMSKLLKNFKMVKNCQQQKRSKVLLFVFQHQKVAQSVISDQ